MSSPEKKKRKTVSKKPLLKPHTPQSTPNPSLPLPLDLQLTCLSRVSRSYYPTLSLVSKTFQSLIASPELYQTRSSLNRTESCLYVCLKLSPDSNPRWFTLCRKPNHTKKTKAKKKTSRPILVPVPFPHSASPSQASSFVALGSNIYEFGGGVVPSSNVSILDCRSHTRNKAPNMLMDRENPSAYAIDGKICVVDNIKDMNSINFKDVFDVQTQTWKSASIHDEARANDLKEGIYPLHIWCLWCSYHALLSCCVIDNVFWCYKDGEFEWFDHKVKGWRILKDMKGQLPKFTKSCNVQLADYGGKMAVLWHKHDRSSNSKGRVIWCAEITLERCNTEEISGKVEWFDPVLQVPKLFSFVSILAPTV